MIVDIEVVPQPLGTSDEPVRARRGRDRARAELGPALRSERARITIEGPPDDVWPLPAACTNPASAGRCGAR